MPQYNGFLITCQKAFLLHFKPFNLACFHICSVLKPPFAISSKLQRKIEASGSFGAIYFLPFSSVLFTYPTGANPI
ncbi:hypothetical protein QW060_09370 [Myroides ceti]|uniref:Uncharacterized protein n=1 Tax=Paenimyroides ceti TaxID=395087 RepID=A0ABT8CS52_9FLAO|nr:hypothetical protein [Paenimyroides ceti]MDN3707344.1 hypothetical protein [Paenimyroides ceti]